jgi:putative membrane protein
MERLTDMLRRWYQHPHEYWSRRLLTVYLALVPGSLFAVSLNLVPPDARWFGGVLLGLLGLVALIWLWEAVGRVALTPTLTILCGSTLIEYIGATTEQPFGSYDYSAVLGYRIAAVVPAVIPLAWLMVMYGAWCMVTLFAPALPRWQHAIASGAVVALFDLQIEPTAVHINGYWQWHVDGFYYGVPFQNFVAWFVVGTVFAAVADPMLRGARRAGASLLPIVGMAGSAVLFIAMNSIGGYYAASLLSILMLGALTWRLQTLTR